jgi:hypothetical protein
VLVSAGMENECAVLTIEIHLLLEHLPRRNVMLSAIIVLLSSGIDINFLLLPLRYTYFLTFAKAISEKKVMLSAVVVLR